MASWAPGPRPGGSGGSRMTSGTSGVWIMLGHYFVSRYTVNLYTGRRSSSADPVPAFRGLRGLVSITDSG